MQKQAKISKTCLLQIAIFQLLVDEFSKTKGWLAVKHIAKILNLIVDGFVDSFLRTRILIFGVPIRENGLLDPYITKILNIFFITLAL